ncbi:unnamed protein product, partial [Closterium sp. NIES-54]
SPQQNGVAKRRIGLVMEVARTSMCHADAPQFLWPQAVRYAAHQLNMWPSDARPRMTPVSLWTVTYQFFASQDVTFDESICYYRSRPHRASPPSRHAPSGVSHVTPQSSPPQRPVPVMSGGTEGAVAEGEGTRATEGGGVGSGGAVVVGVEVTPVEDTAASSRRPRPASPPGFPSIPQFPPRQLLRSLGVFPREVLEALGVSVVEVLVLGVLEQEALALWRLHRALYAS